MYRTLSIALLIAFLMLCQTAQVAHASHITFMTHSIEDNAFIDEHGELRGKENGGRRAFSIELVREMMILMDHSMEFQEVSFKRGLKTVQQESDHALFNVSRTLERENTVKWVGPIRSSKNYFYELAEAPTGVKTLEDARKVNCVSVLNGNVQHNFLVKNGFKNLETTNSYIANFKMLVNKRCPLIPSSGSSLPAWLKEADLPPDAVLRTPVMLFETKGYLAFSKNIPDVEIQRWQDALEQIKKSGKYENLVKKYLQPE